jgi:uncharacterized damage-inducible protein DinB
MKKEIIQRNAQYTRQVEQLMEEAVALGDERLNRKPADGGWSALQTMQHLILTEELSLAYINKKLGFQPELEPAGLGARWRGFLLWAYLSTPFKFKAPKNVGDDNLPEHAALADVRSRWQKVRADWAAFFDTMPDDMAGMAVYKHPRAGRLGWAQTLAFFETHFTRHRQQIRRALEA